MKLHLMSTDMYAFHCPGCRYAHAVTVDGAKFPTTGATWSWNGSMTSPTLSPSLLVFANEPKQRCHSFVHNGNIQFLADSHHVLAGMTVPIPDWDE
jgi:Family of unknown function (DUF6527)